MFYDDHNPPHFHARYGDDDAVIDIKTLTVSKGGIQPRALGLVIEWASQHQKELLADWDLARESQKPKKIKPLK